MGTDLQIAGTEQRLITTEVALGPPNPGPDWAIGALVGVPIGIGIVSGQALLLGIGGGLFGVGLVGSFALGIMRFRRFAADNSAAVSALGRGELAKAHEVLVRWAKVRNLVIRAMARHNLGWTLMLERRVDEAATLLADTAKHHERPLSRVGMLPTTRLDTSLCHALLGNLEVAETWWLEAQKPVNGPAHPSFGGMNALVRAILDCRQGRAAEAVVLLDRAWAEHEGALTGETLRMMRVVRAFACATADGPRNQGIVERVLGDMRPRYEGEFAFLVGAWPGMQAFLAAHRLEA